jgi:hypothetical protein
MVPHTLPHVGKRMGPLCGHNEWQEWAPLFYKVLYMWVFLFRFEFLFTLFVVIMFNNINESISLEILSLDLCWAYIYKKKN